MRIMKKTILVICSFLIVILFFGCESSSKKILKKRVQKMQESSGNPVTIEQIEQSINEYYDDIEEITNKSSKIGLWYKLLGLRQLDKKMYGPALESFQKALEFYPDNANLYYYVGNCASYLGNASLDFEATGSYEKMENYYNLSEKAYLRALSIDDRYVYALYGLSVLYVYQLNSPEKAISNLQKLLTIDTKNIDAMFVLANAYYLTSNYDKAADMFDTIIATTKSDKVKKTAEENKKQVLDEAYSN